MIDFKDVPIDIVYLWVDGNDKEWLQLKQQWAKKLNIQDNSNNICRFNEHEELLYSIRSCLKYAAWINKIYIITNGQIPRWLIVEDNDKIEIITHNTIMPNEALPTFNSEAIECAIDRIKSLSEYFILANDDIFFYKETPKSYFFTDEGKPIIRMVKHHWSHKLKQTNLYCYNVNYAAKLLKDERFYFLESTHSFVPCRKSLYIACKNKFIKEFNDTLYRKFRAKNSVQKTLISFYSVKEDKAELEICSDVERRSKDLFINLKDINEARNVIALAKPYTFCLNDFEDTPEESREKIPFLLETIFPIETMYERKIENESLQITPAFKDQSVNIVLTPDDNYAKYVAATISSIVKQSSNEEKYDLVIFDSNISQDNKRKLKSLIPSNFSLRFIKIDDVIKKFFPTIVLKSSSYWSVSSYYRLLIPIIMRNFSKVLYLDSDICLNGSIENFYYSYYESEIVAIRDTVSPRLCVDSSRKRQMIDDLKLLDTTKYFNSGVILFNIDNINLEDYLSRIYSAFKIDNLRFPDQDLLNVVFQGKTCLVSCIYNLQIGVLSWDKKYIENIEGAYRKDFLNALENPIIVHYTGPRKPWHDPSMLWAELFWNNSRKTIFYEDCIFSGIREICLTYSDYMNYSIRNKLRVKYNFYLVVSKLTFGCLRKRILLKIDKYESKLAELDKLFMNNIL